MDWVLVETLRAAVPLRIGDLLLQSDKSRTWLATRWAADAVDPIASRGDVLQFGGKKGEAAAVFNHLAKGLAALAMVPGGVVFAGTHWCIEHRWGLATPPGAGPLACTATGLAEPMPARTIETVSASILEGPVTHTYTLPAGWPPEHDDTWFDAATGRRLRGRIDDRGNGVAEVDLIDEAGQVVADVRRPGRVGRLTLVDVDSTAVRERIEDLSAEHHPFPAVDLARRLAAVVAGYQRREAALRAACQDAAAPQAPQSAAAAYVRLDHDDPPDTSPVLAVAAVDVLRILDGP
jgi:hypothetical protein